MFWHNANKNKRRFGKKIKQEKCFGTTKKKNLFSMTKTEKTFWHNKESL